MDFWDGRRGERPNVRVLVVEDDDEARDVLVAMLRKLFGVFAEGAAFDRSRARWAETA